MGPAAVKALAEDGDRIVATKRPLAKLEELRASA